MGRNPYLYRFPFLKRSASSGLSKNLPNGFAPHVESDTGIFKVAKTCIIATGTYCGKPFPYVIKESNAFP
jgi:hypothetical protein